MRRFLSHLRSFFVGTALALIFVLVSATAYSSSSTDPNESMGRNAPPQQAVQIPDITTPKTERMVDVGGRRLNSCVYGKGSPTVVLVSGFGAPQTYWNPVVPDLAAKTTVLTYDRAGIGKSEIGNLPTHGKQAATDLHALLDKLDLPKPYIVVGHSYGGSVVRLFASMYPDGIGGIILEDSQMEGVLEEQRKILKGKDLEQLEEIVAKFAPPDNPKTEGDYRDITEQQVKNSGPLPQVPFVVLTAGDRSKGMPPIFSEDARKKMVELGLEMQKKLVELIPGGKQLVINDVGHNIHIEKPEALIKPVIEMIEEVQSKQKIGDRKSVTASKFS
jgi:pimeloyl-ACP methyl ester carboxylesterase